MISNTLYLLRHAEGAPSRDISENSCPLSATGKQEIASIIPHLHILDIPSIYSRPYKRSVQTVEPFASRNELKIIINQNLRGKKLTDQ